MKNNNLNSGIGWKSKGTIGLYFFNSVIHLYCIVVGLNSILFGSIDELKIYLIYFFLIVSISFILGIHIMIFNNMDNVKIFRFENYMMIYPVYIILLFDVTQNSSRVGRLLFGLRLNMNEFHIAVIIFSVLGIIISIRAIRNLYQGLEAIE